MLDPLRWQPRLAERRFGWGRHTVAKGLHELQSGIRCVENFHRRGAQRSEDKNPQLAQDVRAIVEPHTYADREQRSSRRYSNLSAAEVLDALRASKGYWDDALPRERAMRDILNRMGYRLKRVVKGKPPKKTKETDTIFANIAFVLVSNSFPSHDPQMPGKGIRFHERSNPLSTLSVVNIPPAAESPAQRLRRIAIAVQPNRFSRILNLSVHSAAVHKAALLFRGLIPSWCRECLLSARQN